MSSSLENYKYSCNPEDAVPWFDLGVNGPVLVPLPEQLVGLHGSHAALNERFLMIRGGRGGSERLLRFMLRLVMYEWSLL